MAGTFTKHIAADHDGTPRQLLLHTRDDGRLAIITSEWSSGAALRKTLNILSTRGDRFELFIAGEPRSALVAMTSYSPEDWPYVIEWLINDCWNVLTSWEMWVYPGWRRLTYRHLSKKRNACLQRTLARLMRRGRIYVGR